MLKEREELIYLSVKIDKFRHPNDVKNSEYRVIELFKEGLDPSLGLSECIASIKQHYPWSHAKVWSMRFLSIFINLIFGWTMYSLDFGTDINFSMEMFEKINRNFTTELAECKQKLEPLIDDNVENCKYDFGSQECYNSLKFAERKGRVCFETENRFHDPFEWKLAGIVALIHVILPILFSLLIFIISSIQLREFSLSHFPFPVFTKLRKVFLDWRLFNVLSNKEDGKKTEGKRKIEAIMDELNNILIMDELDRHQNIMNLALIIEASFEAGFQFWFQTIYLLPSLLVGILDIRGSNEITDLTDTD